MPDIVGYFKERGLDTYPKIIVAFSTVPEVFGINRSIKYAVVGEVCRLLIFGLELVPHGFLARHLENVVLIQYNQVECWTDLNFVEAFFNSYKEYCAKVQAITLQETGIDFDEWIRVQTKRVKSPI